MGYESSPKRQPTPGPRLRKLTDLGHQSGKDFTGPGNRKKQASWDDGKDAAHPVPTTISCQRDRGGSEWTDLTSLTTEFKGKEKGTNSDLSAIE